MLGQASLPGKQKAPSMNLWFVAEGFAATQKLKLYFIQRRLLYHILTELSTPFLSFLRFRPGLELVLLLGCQFFSHRNHGFCYFAHRATFFAGGHL